jgi:predicted ester cyclase
MKKLLMITSAIILFASCNNSGSSSQEKKDSAGNMSSNMSSTENKEERNKQTVSDAVKAVNTGNVDELAKYFAPDMVDYGDGTMPAAKSSDSVRAMLHVFVNTFPDMNIDPIVTAADGDYVIVYSHWSGTFKNDMMGIKATGKSFKTKDADIFKFNDEGKIVEHWSVMPMDMIWKGVEAKMPSK